MVELLKANVVFFLWFRRVCSTNGPMVHFFDRDQFKQTLGSLTPMNQILSVLTCDVIQEDVIFVSIKVSQKRVISAIVVALYYESLPVSTFHIRWKHPPLLQISCSQTEETSTAHSKTLKFGWLKYCPLILYQ